MTKDFLFRQVHPAHLQNGLSSGAFRPTPSDKDQLSVDCGNMTTAETAYEIHKKKTKLVEGGREYLQTAGTWAFTRQLCHSEKLVVSPDPIRNEEFQPDNPAHHLVDFSVIVGKPSKKNDTVAKRLRQQAIELNKLWPLD